MPSNTLLLIPNEFETVFELGVQRLEILGVEIRYSQALAKPERSETFSHNRLLEALKVPLRRNSDNFMFSIFLNY